jgi:hypothetical protein
MLPLVNLTACCAPLQSNSVKLRQLFDQFDTDGSKRLEATELYNLLDKVLPNSTVAERSFFAVMIDIHGEQSVDYPMLVQVSQLGNSGGGRITRSLDRVFAPCMARVCGIIKQIFKKLCKDLMLLTLPKHSHTTEAGVCTFCDVCIHRAHAALPHVNPTGHKRL